MRNYLSYERYIKECVRQTPTNNQALTYKRLDKVFKKKI